MGDVPHPGHEPRTPAEALRHVQARLRATRSAEEVVAVVRGAARRLLGSDGVAITLREGDLCHYVEEDAVGPLWKGQRFPAASCISGLAMLSGRTVVIPDIEADPRVLQPLYRRTFVRSLALAPAGRPARAALGSYWAAPYAPSGEEIDTLETLASAVGEALARLEAAA